MNAAVIPFPAHLSAQAKDAVHPALFGFGSGKENWYDQLKGLKFHEYSYNLGADGQWVASDNPRVVTPQDLKAQLNGQFTTMTFGFGGCAYFCPLTVPNLADASAKVKAQTPSVKLTHVVVGVFGDSDKDSLPNEIAAKTGGTLKPGENLRIIFPLDASGNPIFPDSVAPMRDIYERLGIIANTGREGDKQRNQNHPTRATLYNPNGDKLVHALGTEKDGKPENLLPNKFPKAIAEETARCSAKPQECRAR